MIPVTVIQEVPDADVENVVRSALTKEYDSRPWSQYLYSEEFTVDGFQESAVNKWNDGNPFGNTWSLVLVPATILHNLRKTVERAGLQVENIIISPLAMIKSVLNEEGEREVGATVIDLGGGQTTVASVRNQNLNLQISTELAITSTKIFLKYWRLLEN